VKTLTRLINLILLVIFVESCGKSPKSILASECNWIISKSKEKNDISTTNEIKLTDSTLIDLNNNNVYNIKWIDNKKFSTNLNGQDVIVEIREISKDKLQAAFLFVTEKSPQNDTDWINLQNEERTLYLNKTNIKVEPIKQYKIAGKTVPIDKIPPAGLYKSEDVEEVINVIIRNGVVQFQAGENENSLANVGVDIICEGVEPFLSSITFKNDWGTFDYARDGIIENSGSWFNGMSGRTIQFIHQNSSTNNKTEDSYLLDMIKNVSNIEYIFKDGTKTGRLIIKKFIHDKRNNGFLLNIPTGKMWTPLYFDYSRNCEYITQPMIYTERLSSKGWENASSYHFPLKKEFDSYKVSIRNNKALSGEKAIMFTENEYCEKILYTFYFIEE